MSFAETLRSELARRLVSKRVVSREYYAYDASADPLFEKKHPRDHGKFTSKHKAVMSTALARTGKFEHAPVSVELKEHPAGKHRGFAVHWTENGQTTVHAPKIGLQHRDAISHAVNKMWRLHGSKDAPEQAQDSEPKPPTPGFTGMAPPDSLGRVYYWENGKRVANPNAIEGVTQEKGGSHGVLEDSSGGSGGGGVHAGPPVGTTAREPLGNGPAEGLGRTESQRQPTGLPDNRDGGGGEAIAGRDRGRGRPGGDAGTGDGGIVGAGDGRPGRSTGLDGGRGERDGDSGSGEGPSEARGEQGQVAAVLQQRPTPKAPTDLAAGNWRYHTRDFFTGGLKTKAANNIAALRTMREIALEGRTTATPAEQEILSKFVGWGQFPALFHESYSPELKGVISPEELKTESGKWDKERETLQSLMSDDEWESAKGATLNSHYTHPAIVDAHWNMARRLGFTGGKFLETSAGLGYYLGQMPADIAGQTHTTAVELDKTTGAMLDLLYPAANVNIEGFEEHLAPHNFYDLVASNVPFGDYQVHDKDYNKFKAPIHDYFFLKSANLTKPGGLVMHITSTGTMDKPDDRIRKELAKTCDIVAAYRFPGGAHQENAGTQVVTDMVILRKRHPGEQPVSMDETPPEAMPPHKPESLSESLAKAAKATNARRTRIGQALDSLETGHTISANGQKWTLTQVGEDRFWIGGKGGVGLTGSQLLETVGGNTLKGHIGEDILNPEPEPDAEGFTGMTTDSLGRVYHWRDGKRIPGPQWMNVTQVADPDGGEAITVNQYFADHPENILGSLDRSGTMYSGGEKGVSSANAAELTAALGRNVGVVVDDNQRRKFIFTDDGSNVPAAEVRRIGKDNLDRRLKEAIERLPENVLHTSNAPTVEQPEGTLAATSDVVDGAYVVKDGKLYRRDKGALLPQAMNAEATANISGQVAIRAAMMDSLNAQAAGQDATEARKRLNAAYDAYVAKFGPLSATANKKLMKNTPDAGPLLALEQYSPDTNTAKKADMFAQDTVRASAPPGKADNVEDALGISLHRFAKIDVDHMATLLGKDASEVSEELVGRGLAYEDPSAGWVSSDLYLSGNVRRKLIQAKAAAAVDPKYQANVDALLKHQPQDVGFEKIRAKIGAPWVPASDVSEFAAELVGGTPGDIAVDFVPETGEWMVNYSDRKPWLRGSQAAKSWGTPARRFDTLLEAALNDTPVVVRNTEKDIKDGMPAVDAEATEAAQAVVSRMKAEFEDWIWSDEARRTRLHRYYNDNFNNITDIRYNGSHLTLPGMSTRFEGRDFEMRPMQKDFIWRVITSGRGMAGHEVGTGKTSTMVAAAMELRRLGLAKKPAICCLKSNIEQMTREAQEHYPNAKILSLVGNFDAQKRKETVSRIASGDYDMVFLTHDNLEMLPVSPAVQQRFIQDEIDRMEEAAYAAKEEGNKNIVKNIEKRKKSLQTKLKKAIDASSKDNAVTFEQTGIDQLFIDEAHYFKNLPVASKQQMKGIPTADSNRAIDLLMRARYLQERSGGRGLVLATGTPITNTLAELYNFQRFLQPDELKERGIDNFDSWCKVFADSESRIEMKVTGAREAVTRLTRFTNLPELRQIVGQVFDVQRADDQRTPDGGAQIIRPKPSFETHASEPTEGTKRMMDDLYSRGEDLKKKSGPPMKGDDNMLAICTDGRKGAVDLRLLYKDAEDDPGSKANQCVAKVLSVYHGRPNTTQMIFSNVGVHPSNKHDFHLYQDVIDKLVAGGVPREEILDFSNLEGEAKKEAQNALRSGKARIALGSTEKLGTGVNAQHKLSDIHHLDVPWIPTAIEQRNGRGIRQGNMNDPTKAKEDQTVNLHTYVQKGSLDETFWQIVSNKQRFISDYIGGKDNTTRELREDDTEELRPEELAAVASGDPDMLERMRLTQDIERLRRGAARHMRDQDGYRAKVEEMEAALPDLEAAVDDHEQDLKHLQDNEAFNFTVGVRKHTERKTAAPHLEEVSKMVMDRFEQTPSWRRYQLEPENIGVYRGMKVLRNVPGKGAALLLEGPSGRRYEASDTLGSLEAAARGIAKHKARAMDKIPQMRADLEKVRSNIGKPFYGAKDLSMAQLRLAELDAKVTHKPQPTATEGAETAKEPPAAAPKPTVRKEVAAPVSRPDSESEREAAPPPPPAETTGEHPLYRDYEDYVANMKEKGFGARTWQTWIADKEAHDERRKKALAEHEKHPEWKNYKDYVAQMERLRVEGRPFLAWLDWKANAA